MGRRLQRDEFSTLRFPGWKKPWWRSRGQDSRSFESADSASDEKGCNTQRVPGNEAAQQLETRLILSCVCPALREALRFNQGVTPPRCRALGNSVAMATEAVDLRSEKRFGGGEPNSLRNWAWLQFPWQRGRWVRACAQFRGQCSLSFAWRPRKRKAGRRAPAPRYGNRHSSLRTSIR